jgi:tetratricopeptide (TPR) repeat protein
MNDHPITPSDFFHRGLESLEAGRFSEALSYFEAAVDAEYFDADIHMPMAEALFEVGRFNDAISHFDKAVAAGAASSHDALLGKGQCYHELKRFRRALAAYNRVIDADPNRAEAHFKRGVALLDSGSPEKALEALIRAEDLVRTGQDSAPLPEAEMANDALAEVMIWRGRALTRLGRRHEGLEQMFEAHSLVPDHPGPYHEIADSFRFGGDMATAEEWYRKGLERLPDDPTLHNDFGNLLRDMGRYRESVQHLTIAIDRDDARPFAHFNRALSLEQLGLFDEALKDYDVVIDGNDEDLDAKLRKLDLLTRMKLFTDANELLEGLSEAHFKAPETVEARARLANALAVRAEVAGDLKQAIAHHREAVTLHPDFLDVETPGPDDERVQDRLQRLIALTRSRTQDSFAALLNSAARLTLLRLTQPHEEMPERKKFKPVREKLEAALADQAAAPLARRLLAELEFFVFGNDEEALNHCNDALKDWPDFIGALWIKSSILAEGKGRPDLAVKCLKRMLELHPNNPGLLLNVAEIYLEIGSPSRALEYFRRLVSDRTAEVSVHRDIGLCYMALGRYGDAIATFSRLQADGLLQSDVQLDLAHAHLLLGERAEAAALIEQVETENEGLDLAVEIRAIELSAALALARRNPKHALRCLEDVEFDYLTPNGLLSLAKARIALGEFEAAEEVLDHIQVSLPPIAPAAIESRFQLVRVAFAERDFELAHTVLDELEPVAAFDHRLYRMRAWLLRLEGDADGAENVEQMGHYAQRVSALIRLLNYEDYREALTAATEFEEEFPGRIEPRYVKACALAQLGEDDAALDTLRSLVAESPELRARLLDEYYLDPLQLADRIDFRENE